MPYLTTVEAIQNLSLKNSLFQNLGTGEYAWDKDGTSIVDASSAAAKFQNIVDWGKLKKTGNGYSINLPGVAGTVRYFWLIRSRLLFVTFVGGEQLGITLRYSFGF